MFRTISDKRIIEGPAARNAIGLQTDTYTGHRTVSQTDSTTVTGAPGQAARAAEGAGPGRVAEGAGRPLARARLLRRGRGRRAPRHVSAAMAPRGVTGARRRAVFLVPSSAAAGRDAARNVWRRGGRRERRDVTGRRAGLLIGCSSAPPSRRGPASCRGPGPAAGPGPSVRPTTAPRAAAGAAAPALGAAPEADGRDELLRRAVFLPPGRSPPFLFDR